MQLPWAHFSMILQTPEHKRLAAALAHASVCWKAVDASLLPSAHAVAIAASRAASRLASGRSTKPKKPIAKARKDVPPDAHNLAAGASDNHRSKTPTPRTTTPTRRPKTARVITKNPPARKSKKFCVTGPGATPPSAPRPAHPAAVSVPPYAVRLSGDGSFAKNIGDRFVTAALSGTSISANGPLADLELAARYGNAANRLYFLTSS